MKLFLSSFNFNILFILGYFHDIEVSVLPDYNDDSVSNLCNSISGHPTLKYQHATVEFVCKDGPIGGKGVKIQMRTEYDHISFSEVFVYIKVWNRSIFFFVSVLLDRNH